MNYKLYNFVLSEVGNYADKGAFVSDVALSSVWGDAKHEYIPAERIEELEMIWTAAHRTVKDIATEANLSVRQLACRFGIPHRTVEDWSAGRRTPPPYIIMMMQECLGLLPKISS